MAYALSFSPWIAYRVVSASLAWRRVALASPHAAIHRWIAALSAGALAVIALASLAVGQPFTLSIARRSTPAALWDHPEFIRLNRFITSVWTVAFLAAAAGCSLAIRAAP